MLVAAAATTKMPSPTKDSAMYPSQSLQTSTVISGLTSTANSGIRSLIMYTYVSTAYLFTQCNKFMQLSHQQECPLEQLLIPQAISQVGIS